MDLTTGRSEAARRLGTASDRREAPAAGGTEADLVVDASGSDTKAPQWLAAIGAEHPQEETIDTGLA
ncbi:MAG: hypothetical protein ACJ736_07865 [Streptomyces sp.]